MLALAGMATAQGTRQSAKPQNVPSNSGSPPTSEHTAIEQDINVPDEMRVRMAIEREDNRHRKFMEDVKQLDDLSTAVETAYREHNALTSEDFKKIATIEKLAKRILSHAGGSQVDEEKKPSDTPLADVIKEMTESASEISKNLMAQTRHVVSATVISSSNKVINLARFILRSKKQKD